MKKIVILLAVFLMKLSAVDALYVEGVDTFKAGNESLAIELLKKSYKNGTIEAASELYEIYKINYNKGLGAYLKNRYEEAGFYFDKAEYIMENLIDALKYNSKDMEFYVKLLKYYAISLDEQGNSQESIVKFKKALDISKRYSKNKNVEASIFCEFENTLSRQGKHSEAKELFSSFDIDEITDPFWKVSSLKSYAFLLLETDDIDTAIIYFKKALEICKKNIDTDKKYYTQSIAEIYHLLGKSIAKKEILEKRNALQEPSKKILKQALDNYNESLKYLKEMPHNREYFRLKSNVLLEKAIYYRNIGDLVEDEKTLKKLEKLLRNNPLLIDNRTKNNLYYNFALLYFTKNNMNLATNYLDKMKQIQPDNLALYHKLKADIKCKKIGCTK